MVAPMVLPMTPQRVMVDADPITPGIQGRPGMITPVGFPRYVGGPQIPQVGQFGGYGAPGLAQTGPQFAPIRRPF